MNGNGVLKWLLYSLLVLSTVILVGCNGSSGGDETGDNPVRVISITTHPDYVESAYDSWDAMEVFMKESGAESLALSTSLGGFGTVAEGSESTFSLWEIFKLIVNALWNIGLRPVHLCVSTAAIEYEWADGGNPESGLLVSPRAMIHTHDYPMIVLMHPTQTERSQSPSNNIFDNEITTPFAKVLARLGYIVLVPDYPGLGINHDVHPYCLSTLSRSATGMIYAAKQTPLRWDGRIFLMGYSEGGYVTLATAKDMQLNHPDLNLVAAAALDGPHSLSDTMRNLMLSADAQFKTPYFMPYVVAGYGEQYPEVIHFNTAVVDQPEGFNWSLYQMLFGEYAGGQISTKMEEVNPYEGPRSILTPATLNALNNPASELNQVFKDNDSFYDWTPSADLHILLCHNPYDETVPVENSRLAKQAWNNLANVEVLYFTEMLEGEDTVHAGALPYAYIKGITWINSQAAR